MFSDFACLMIIFICSSNSKILLLSEMINILKLFQYSGIQVYAIANLGNTSYIDDSIEFFMELPAFFWNSTPFLLNHISRHKGVWKLEFNSQSKSPCYIAKKKNHGKSAEMEKCSNKWSNKCSPLVRRKFWVLSWSDFRSCFGVRWLCLVHYWIGL